ncbi:MAG TPA: glutamate racemase [Candidatus Saccharimonadales bacterium]|nr:glutamate racemase [Candidatus Saccharimonadales bacterium]
MPKIKIGVFDSGVGAVPVIEAIQKALPNLEIVYKDDRAHLPYGTRSVEQIHQFIRPIFQSFIDEDCRVIVIACNTVTTNLIDELRAEFSVPLIGMEPAVKPAAEATKTGVIAVCATPRTLSSHRYAELKHKYAKGVTVLEPDCKDWSLMVENNRLDREKIANTVEKLCQQNADQIVLGCTHYHWIEYLIDSCAKGRVAVIQPTKPVVKQLKSVLEQLT